jgi:hypothetical protein
MSDTASEERPGWEVSDFGALRLTLAVVGEHITLATLMQDAETA